MPGSRSGDPTVLPLNRCSSSGTRLTRPEPSSSGVRLARRRYQAKDRGRPPGLVRPGFYRCRPIPILAAPGHMTRQSMDIPKYFQDYLTVGAFAALGVVLVMVMLGVAAVLRPSNP